jgi:cytochrome P450
MQSGNYHRTLHKLHNCYGPVVRVAPDELVFTNAEAWKDVYGNLKIAKSGKWTRQEEEHHPISIVSTDEQTHLRNRRALTGAFTEHAICEHASVLESLVGTMITKFKESTIVGDGRAVVDVTDWLSFLTFDVGGALAFGKAFGSVKNGRAHPWVAISCGFGKGIALMASINFFQPLDKLLKLAMPRNIMEKMSYHKQLAHEKFEQRLAMEHKVKAQDYVGSIMAYNEEKDEVRIPKAEIEANMVLLIFAGSDTTSTAITAVLTQLLQNSAALTRVQEEVRSVFKSESDVTVASSAQLTYLDAVIREGVRMGPPAAIGMPRITPKEGAIIAGRYVPGGVSDSFDLSQKTLPSSNTSQTLVSVNQYPTFRSPSNFTRPDSFIPERFLDASPFLNDRLDAFMPFLLGRHKCLGQKLAWAITRLTLARLLFSFDLRMVDEPRDFGDQKTYIFWEKRALNDHGSDSN